MKYYLGKITAKEFAEINNIEVGELKNFGDACVGADELQDDTILTIQMKVDNDGGTWLNVWRNDNPWNDTVDVISGEARNWILPENWEDWESWTEG